MKKSFILLTSLLALTNFSCAEKTTDYLTFIAIENNSQFVCTHSHAYKKEELPFIYASTDAKNWKKIIINDETVFPQTTFATLNKGEKVYLKGRNPNGISKSEEEFIHFGCIDALGSDHQFASEGNIMSLISDSNLDELKEIPCDYCFTRMFGGTDYCGCRLINAPKLPAIKLTAQCYSYMFFDNEDIETPSELPSIELKEKCYAYMFAQCTKLKTSPALKAVDTAPYCYDHMFYGNSSLTNLEIHIKDWDREGNFPCCFWVSTDGRYPMSSYGTFRCPKELIPDVTDPNNFSETRVPYHWTIETF